MKVAIYSRKSVFTGKGESIENQIQMCKDYYSKINNSEAFTFEIYEDEGYTGANIKRPEFQRLLSDIKKNKISTLICYRLDRISRNVADFSSILELLQSHNVSFISIKEQFDTQTPIGKAMVYIASVFAQLERDTIAERIKDNMLELSKTGRWLGGQPPLGFKSKKISYFDDEFNERTMYKLSPIKDEMNIVKHIFNQYLISGSIHYVLKDLLIRREKGKNGGEFAAMSIRDILKNPVYVKSNNKVKEYLEGKGMLFFGTPNQCGIMIYNKKIGGKKLNPATKWIAAVGQHKGIIPATDWLNIQENLDASSTKNKFSIRLGTSEKAILTGVLKCAKCGSPMRVTYGRIRHDGTRTYYYTCTLKCHSGKARCNNPNANGPILDLEIVKNLIHYDESILKEKLKTLFYNTNHINLDNDTNSINIEISSLKSQIDILMEQLSKTQNKTSQDLLLKKIDSLSNKLNDLINTLNNSSQNKKNNTASRDIKIIKNSINDLIYSSIFINKEVKPYLRNLINKLVDKITYDGNTNNVVIYLLASKKNK